MKREIKFRGQCQSTKQWVFGLPSTETTLAITINYIAQFAGSKRKFGRTNVRVIPESVGQFTGLTDKNDLEIYEGDISDFHIIGLGRGKATVIFNDGCFFFDVEGQEGLFPFPELTKRNDIQIEIIGTIHDPTPHNLI